MSTTDTGLAVGQVPQVYTAISKVMADIVTSGVSKSRRNKEQGFDFRGIDDAFMSFAPLLVKHGLILAPSYADKVIEPRQTKSGGTTYNVSLSGMFTFTCVHDGSKYVVGPFFGEANDGQDKAVSKATSVAERNMFFLTFVVPHEPAIGGDPDATGEEPATVMDIKSADWIREAKGLQSIEDYSKAKDKMRAEYGGLTSNIPADVREAFNYAKERVTPKATQ